MGASAYETDPLQALLGWPPSGSIAETFPRRFVQGAQFQPATGTMILSALYVPAGKLITNVTFVSGSTAEASGTHLWFALYDLNLNLLQQTPDDVVAGSFGANTAKTKALNATVTTTYSGLYYAAFMCAGTTIPGLLAFATSATTVALAPVLSGSSSTGLTTTAPASAAALTGQAAILYAYLS